MSEISTTSNGNEIESPRPKITAQELQGRLEAEYGINGTSPMERMQQLRKLSVEGVAILLEDINKSVQGSEGSLIADYQMKIGDKPTIKPEDRYDVFCNVINAIKDCPDDVRPERVADVLALTTVILHPFQDGNGRTARVIGLMFREGYEDTEGFQRDFDIATEPRDQARARGGFMINGYVPHYPEGFDQTDPAQVTEYLTGLLQQESPNAYTSCFGQVPLRSQA